MSGCADGRVRLYKFPCPFTKTTGYSYGGHAAPITQVKLHSKRVEKMQDYTRNEWRRCTQVAFSPNPSESDSVLSLGGSDHCLIQWKCVGPETAGTRGIFPTRFECSFASSPLVSSVFLVQQPRAVQTYPWATAPGPVDPTGGLIGVVVPHGSAAAPV